MSDNDLNPVAVRRVTAARLLDCSEATVHKLIQEGKLDVVKVGADQRVTYESLKRVATPAAA